MTLIPASLLLEVQDSLLFRMRSCGIRSDRLPPFSDDPDLSDLAPPRGLSRDKLQCGEIGEIERGAELGITAHPFLVRLLPEEQTGGGFLVQLPVLGAQAPLRPQQLPLQRPAAPRRPQARLSRSRQARAAEQDTNFRFDAQDFAAAGGVGSVSALPLLELP